MKNKRTKIVKKDTEISKELLNKNDIYKKVITSVKQLTTKNK